jgi:flavin-dependent dehydrogenase
LVSVPPRDRAAAVNSVEVLIVGGGPAGAATAYWLARSGCDVMVLERASGPRHKVCGEFLSIETQAHLSRLGVDPAALGAVPVDELTLYAGTRPGTVALPFRALSLSRYCLDEALLQQASRHGAEVKRGVLVKRAEPLASGWRVQCGDGVVVRCRTLVLATGKHALRGIDDRRNATMVGLKLHLKLSPRGTEALRKRVELFLTPDGYCGLELVEGDVANLCVLLRRTAVPQAGWLNLRDYLASVSEDLGQRLRDGSPLWERPLAVVCPSGGYSHMRSIGAEHPLYRVGDRMAHIPPFTGDGLAIALASAELAAVYIRNRQPPDVYRHAFRRRAASALLHASALSWMNEISFGRALIASAASRLPWLLQAAVRQTRLRRGTNLLT